jgi:NADPH:quinone reductase-like Zn-dependent oxidoreductase
VVGANLRRESLAAQAMADGAELVTISDDLATARRHGPFDVILESVGGPALGNALTMLAPGGICVAYGNSLRSATSFNVHDFFRIGGTRLYGLYLIEALQRLPAGDGLGRLVSLVAAGRLKPRIAVEASWEQVAEIAARLYGRDISGKAVLHV